MRQICNLVYFHFTDGRTAPQIAEFDVLLSDPTEKEDMLARQNAEAMKALQSVSGGGFIPPPRRIK